MPFPSGSLQAPLWRALAVFRIASLAYVAVLVLLNASGYAHPVAAVPVLLAMAGWTGFATYAYARPAWRGWPLLLADLMAALGALLVTLFVVGRPAVTAGVPTLAIAWVGAPVVAWAISGGRRRGTVAALILAAADLAVRGRVTQSWLNGTALMLLAGIAVGHVARLAVTAQERLRRAVELAAATRERERLARDIHDSVLQVLALVQRRGARLDGEAGELARLAGEQEAALRALIATGPPDGGPSDGGPLSGPFDGGPDPALDLRTLLGRYASADVSIAAPATPVWLPARIARELGAAVGAALDNVNRHGHGRAWILVEDEPDTVTVSIRDEGPGIPPGRLAEAAGQGRLGVAQSIQGRLAGLGGSVRIRSASGEGTEVELVLPTPERPTAAVSRPLRWTDE